MRPVFTWNLGSRSLELGKRTLLMGIVNVTPDSFSDGGEHLAPEAAIAYALKLLDDGADIVDVGRFCGRRVAPRVARHCRYKTGKAYGNRLG